MTAYKLCRRLHEVLPVGIRVSLKFAGLLRTVRVGNRDVFIKSDGVRTRLRETIERTKQQSEETIRRCQLAIDIIEGKTE